MAKNTQLLSTLVYIYIIILVFTILYYFYNNYTTVNSTANISINTPTSSISQITDNFQQTPSVKDEYERIVSNNMTRISDYIARNNEAKNENTRINNVNKARIKQLMDNSVSKLSAMIDNYISNI